MDRARILVVFYSRTGRTEDVAFALRRAFEAEGIECALEPLEESKSRRGIIGYLRSGRDSLLDRPADIAPLAHDVTSFDVVVVGTPVWGASPSTPVRAFLRRNGSRLEKVAFYLTHGGSGRDRTFSALARLAGKTPLAELALREKDFARGDHRPKIQAFAENLMRRIDRYRSEPAGVMPSERHLP